MPESSTTYRSKWRSGVTRVIRVPEVLADQILEFARELDSGGGAGSASEPGDAPYRSAQDVSLHEPVNVAMVPQRSPFRYPGGKTWLVPYLRSWLRSAESRHRLFIEPFAGGGIASLTVAAERLADHTIMVEMDPDVAAVWRTILHGGADWLANEIRTFTLSRATVTSALAAMPTSLRNRAFATILRNRVQRGGIMAKGAGLVKGGENGKGLASRWYPETLARRIEAIVEFSHRLTFIEGDAFRIIRDYADDPSAAFFVDPPYTQAAKRLYSAWQVDHGELFRLMQEVKGQFLVTYDNTREIAELAAGCGFDTAPIAMKNTHHARMTELLIGRDLSWLRRAQSASGSMPQTRQGTLAFPP